VAVAGAGAGAGVVAELAELDAQPDQVIEGSGVDVAGDDRGAAQRA